jgi:hypothetical protein
VIRIAISAEAFEAIARTLPLGSVSFENKTDEEGQRLIWLDRAVVDRLRSLRVSRRGRDLGFTRRRQCGPCDLNRLRNSLGDFGARLCGIVSCPKRERENGLPTFVEDIKAKAQVRHPGDFAHCAVLVDEARHVFVS